MELKKHANIMTNLREPMQRKGGVKHVDGPCRKQTAVEGARNAGGKVGTVVVSCQTLLHAAAVGG